MNNKHKVWLVIAIIGFAITALFLTGCQDPTGGTTSTACLHTFGEWVTTTPPSVDKDGKETRTCTKCGHSEKRALAALGSGDPDCEHAYGEWVITTQPTATQDGGRRRTCTKCGHTQTHTLPATGDPECQHSTYGEWLIKTAATCTEDGEIKRTCTNCPKSEIEPVGKLGHDMPEAWTQSSTQSCVSEGIERKDCQREHCEHFETQPIAALGHTGEWSEITPATETTDGEEKRVCGHCGVEETRALYATGTLGLEFILVDNDTAYSVLNGTASGAVTIPAFHNNLPVTTIADDAFRYSYLTSITIPNSVTSIGISAFTSCTSLTSITIPDSVTSIGDMAFFNCTGLTSITIPSSVTSIGNEVFTSCISLTSVTIPDSVTSIGYNPFVNCSNLTDITVESGNTMHRSEGNCLIRISDNTLIAGCKNSVIPSGVTRIGNYAFEGCSGLTSITIPDSVSYIDSAAFRGCSGLTSIIIPASVSYISWGAFQKTGIWDNTPDNSVVYADKWAVGYKGTLSSVSLQDDTVGISGSAFANCNSLTSITIPSSVTSIITYAFSNCTNLSVTWYYNPSLTAFEFKSYLKTVIIPDGVTSIGNNAFANCNSLTSITIPSSVTSIGNYAFSSCSSLTSVTIPDSVIIIDDYAFADCSSLTSITIPSNVASIGENIFAICIGLTSIDVESTNTMYRSEGDCLIRISDNTLIAGCKNSIIPYGVTSIAIRAFFRCSSLSSITIPNSVTSIGIWAFDSCTGLTSVTFQGAITPANFNSSTFPGDLREKYLAVGGGIGTYTRVSGSNIWIKQE